MSNAKHPFCTLPDRAGLGLKPEHYREILDQPQDVGFFEIHAENYFVDGGPFHEYLTRIRERCYPLSIHGVGLSLAGEAPLDQAHLQQLRQLIDRYQPDVFSEHLAWASHGGVFFNDLLPVPYHDDTLRRVCEHLDVLQNYLGRRILLENPATYVEFEASTYAEQDFIREVVLRSGCGLLLDVNNLYVSCVNHGRDCHAYLQGLPLEQVGEIHLAGFHREADSSGAPLLIDSHSAPVDSAVWCLYREVLAKIGPMPTLLEWDHHLPDWNTLRAEARHIDAELHLALAKEAA